MLTLASILNSELVYTRPLHWRCTVLKVQREKTLCFDRAFFQHRRCLYESLDPLKRRSTFARPVAAPLLRPENTWRRQWNTNIDITHLKKLESYKKKNRQNNKWLWLSRKVEGLNPVVLCFISSRSCTTTQQKIKIIKPCSRSFNSDKK